MKSNFTRYRKGVRATIDLAKLVRSARNLDLSIEIRLYGVWADVNELQEPVFLQGKKAQLATPYGRMLLADVDGEECRLIPTERSEIALDFGE